MSQEALTAQCLALPTRQTIAWKLHWVLRIALFCEFVGHGAFGVLTKAAWVPYFQIFGIPEAWARHLMPVVGSVDILLGTLALVAPIRAALLYMAFWGLFTASLRPLAGQGWWEFFERSYNFGVPFFMLWMHGCGTTVTSWLAVITTVPRVTRTWACRAQWLLRGIMASMLIGHGGYGLVMGKSQLLQLYTAAGLGAMGVPLPTVSAWIGGFEMLLGVLCLWVNVVPFFLFVCAWKLGTEWLFVPAHAYGAWWEVMERGGSYAAPLLWIGLHYGIHGAWSRDHASELATYSAG
jgi:hypothetical protein